jgi:hypothetical protein
MPANYGRDQTQNMQRVLREHHVAVNRGNASGGREWKDFYVYSNPIGLSIAAATAGQPPAIQIEADSDFSLMRIAAYAEAAGETFPYPGSQQPQLTLQLQDGSDSRNLFSSPVPLGLIAGTGQLPFVLPIYRLFNANGTINLFLFNYGAVQYNNIVIALIGVKIQRSGNS